LLTGRGPLPAPVPYGAVSSLIVELRS